MIILRGNDGTKNLTTDWFYSIKLRTHKYSSPDIVYSCCGENWQIISLTEIGSGVVIRKNATVKMLFAVIYVEYAKWSKQAQRFTDCWRYSLSPDFTRLHNGICRQTNDVCIPQKTLTKPKMNVSSDLRRPIARLKMNVFRFPLTPRRQKLSASMRLSPFHVENAF